jgi:hypothetical protein
VHSIVISTCEVIWKKHSSAELPQHREEIWKNMAEEFYSLWQFPNCIAASDGTYTEYKHCIIVDPFSFSYKKTLSVVLLALVDANYKFVIIYVSGYGNQVTGVFSEGPF